MAQELTNLEQLLDLIESMGEADPDRVSLGMIIEAVGSRSFGPLLVLAGVILFSPLSGIPGMPTTMGIFVLFIAIQLLFHKKHFWFPGWVLKRSVTRKKLRKAIRWLRPLARFIDQGLRPRLMIFTRGLSVYLVAIICLLIAAGLPFMELVPFLATTVGGILTAFGLSLTARDGLLALLAFMLTAVPLVLILLL